MFTFDHTEAGAYHVQDLRVQASRDADASVLAHADGPARRHKVRLALRRALAR
jgi:hypothetical protein